MRTGSERGALGALPWHQTLIAHCDVTKHHLRPTRRAGRSRRMIRDGILDEVRSDIRLHLPGISKIK